MTPPGIARPRFVTIDEILAFHEIAIAQFGGAPGVRDRGLLESAIAQACQGFGSDFVHVYPFEMAAAYAFHIAKNHPFVDGNKRAALACCVAFLRMNGWNLVSHGTQAADALLQLIDGGLVKKSFAAWLQSNAQARPSLELRDFFWNVTRQHLRSAQAASVRSPNEVEFGTSFDEACRALPLLAEIRTELGQAINAGKDADVKRLATETSLLMHIYRLAEDMGYEW